MVVIEIISNVFHETLSAGIENKKRIPVALEEIIEALLECPGRMALLVTHISANG